MQSGSVWYVDGSISNKAIPTNADVPIDWNSIPSNILRSRVWKYASRYCNVWCLSAQNDVDTVDTMAAGGNITAEQFMINNYLDRNHSNLWSDYYYCIDSFGPGPVSVPAARVSSTVLN